MHSASKLLLPCLLLVASACNTTSSKVAFSKEEYRVKSESVLYVYRVRAFVGGGMETALFFDGKSVGILPQKGYIPVHALAGLHTIRGCSTGFLAPEDCETISVDMQAKDFKILQLTMQMRGMGPKISFLASNDMETLAESKNEGNYYDSALRDMMPASERRVALTADALGGKPATGAKTTLKVAILDFKDETGSNLYTWLSDSLPDAIDQSMRKDFEYKRQPAETGANLVISGKYEMASGKNGIHIEAKIYFRDTDQILGTEGVDAPLDAELFNSTKILSDKLVAKFHQMVKK
jgi:hypothetical protein